MIAFHTGELLLIDFLKMVEVRNLTQNVKYLDRSEMKQQPKEIENLLKGVSINTFTYAEDGKHLYIGYENGALTALGKNYDECFEEFKQNLTELGIEI